MTTITPSISNTGYAAAASSNTPNVGMPASTEATSTLLTEQMRGQLLQILSTIQSASSGSADSITDERGAPALTAPATSFSADDMVDLLRSIRTKSQDAQLEGAKGSIETARIKAEKNNQDQLQKINEWVEKSRESEKTGLLGKIFSWIGKIAAVIASLAAVVAAAAATVASAGAATPMLMFAVAGLVGSTISLADQISRECGGPEISIGNLLKTMTSEFLVACGVPREQAEKIGKVMAGVTALMMPAMLLVEPSMLGTMASGICELAGADANTAMYVAMAVGIATAVTIGIVTAVASGGSSAASSAATTASKVGTTTVDVATKTTSMATKVTSGLIGSGAQIVGGATSVATGGINIAKAQTQKEADNLLADKKAIEAAMLKLQATMEDGREELKKVIQQIEDGMQVVSQMINGAAESMSQITANMGKRQSV